MIEEVGTRRGPHWWLIIDGQVSPTFSLQFSIQYVCSTKVWRKMVNCIHRAVHTVLVRSAEKNSASWSIHRSVRNSKIFGIALLYHELLKINLAFTVMLVNVVALFFQNPE